VRTRNFIQSLSYALEGLRYALRSQRNMRIHALMALVVLFLAFILGFSPLELAILLLTIVLVLGAELLNTAIEATVDLCTEEYNYLAQRAKNVAAAAVLVCAFFAAAIGCFLFGPRAVALWALLGR